MNFDFLMWFYSLNARRFKNHKNMWVFHNLIHVKVMEAGKFAYFQAFYGWLNCIETITIETLQNFAKLYDYKVSIIHKTI